MSPEWTPGGDAMPDAARHPHPDEEDNGGDVTGFVFSVGGDLYGIDLESVQSAVGLSDLVPLPWVPPHVLGVMRIRGTFEAVISLERVLDPHGLAAGSEEGAEAEKKPRVLLIQAGDLKAGVESEKPTGNGKHVGSGGGWQNATQRKYSKRQYKKKKIKDITRSGIDLEVYVKQAAQ